MKLLIPLIELFKYVVQLAKSGRGLLAYTILLVAASALGGYGGKTYVDKKHSEGIKKVEENQKAIVTLQQNQQQIVTTLKVMQNTLENVNTAMQDVKHTVRQTDDSVRKTQEKVVEIYRDVYQIKLKQQNERGS